ncbi:MAG: TRAM domain-containing protein [Candidatus Saccharibacteria bacterium]|nr:TRAM domain-containing protein [Candidatus Saccharibacteria bacterium]
MQEEIVIEKLVHGGQGMGSLADGRKVFVWNAYPGERLVVRVTKKRRDYVEAVAEDIIKPSSERIKPVDEAFLSTSPWQTLSYAAENTYKQNILEETLNREGVVTPEADFVSPDDYLYYRNKMEYSFWADENGLHLALFHRGTHGKRIVEGSSIARPEVDQTANRICAILNTAGVRGSQLKTVVVRANQRQETVAAIFVKDQDFPEIKELAEVCKGVAVYYSNPKSPASIITKKLYVYDDIRLTDNIAGHDFLYDVNSFFQVNVPLFEQALMHIKQAVNGHKQIVDMYGGVGTIGVSVGADTIVELDEHNVKMAKHNAGQSSKVVQASTEQALDYITEYTSVIFDPPRAGLHDKVVDRVIDVLPPTVVYLSCNPATQARDIAKLLPAYQVKSVVGYNFFPRTPHIESLVILQKSDK